MKKYKQWKFNKSKSAKVLRLAKKLLPTVASRTELVEKLSSRCKDYKADSIEVILSRAHFTTGFRYRKSATPFRFSTDKRILDMLNEKPRTSWELERHFKYSTLIASYRKLRMLGFPIRSTLILARGAGSCKSLIKHQFRIFFMEKDAVKAYALVEKTAGFTLPTKIRQSVGYAVKPAQYKLERATFKSRNPVRKSPNDEHIKELFRHV